MKRILLVVPALGPVYGGPSRIAPALAAALARRGREVDLVATTANGRDDLGLPTGRWLDQEGGWRLQLFPRHGRAGWKPSLALARWLWARVRDYDVAHHQSDFNFPALVCALACRGRRVPYLINPQGMLEPWALAYKGGKKRFYYGLIERPLVLRGAAAIQALNPAEAANLVALRLGPPVVVVPNGIDPAEVAVRAGDREAFRARFPRLDGRPLVLFLHRVDPKKGLDLLAPAFAAARSARPDLHLVVAGPETAGFGPTARGYFQAAGLGDEAVTFTGMLEGPVKRGAFAAATVFVLPSYSEGFSMSVLEAMAAGLPCVLTVGCNFPEAGAAGAALVVEPEPAAYADALAQLLAEPEAARAMGERARELVLAGYTWDRVAAQMAEVFAAVADGGRRTLPHAHDAWGRRDHDCTGAGESNPNP